MKHAATAASLFGAAWLLAGCAADVPPAPIPPPPTAETVPLPPVSATPLIWQPGHWDWTGTAFIWAPGQFVPRAGHGEYWMPGFWDRIDSGWIWRPAHWT